MRVGLGDALVIQVVGGDGQWGVEVVLRRRRLVEV